MNEEHNTTGDGPTRVNFSGGVQDTDRAHMQRLIGEDYRLQWIIGHGGMSTVWLADDLRADREVAIKVLRPEFSNAPEFLERFRNEADAAKQIDSDNVVRTYTYREVPDPAGTIFCFLVMEYIRGESLADMLAREGSLPEDFALDILEQAAHGLSVIHRMDFVHRDIKPGNLLITEHGRVKVTDFGIAKAAEAVPLTRTGMVVGTAQYVSPEQAQGHEVTVASDVYSLGVVGYEMLSGHRPFTGDSSVSVVLAHINQEAPPLSTSTSAQTRELIGIALRKSATARFADGDEFALAVSQVRMGHRPPQPRSTALQGYSAEPSPSASTAALAAAVEPTTMQPQAQQQPAPVAAPPKKKKRSGGGFGLGLGIAVLLIALVGGLGFLAYATGLFDGVGEQEEPTPTSTDVVTEWVTPTEEPETTTRTETPTTVTTHAPEPEPTPSTQEPTPTPAPRPSQSPAPQTSQPQQTNPAAPRQTQDPDEVLRDVLDDLARGGEQ